MLEFGPFLSLSYPSTLCEVMVLAYPSVGEAVGGGEGMRRQTNKQRSHAAASNIHLKHAVTGVLHTHTHTHTHMCTHSAPAPGDRQHFISKTAEAGRQSAGGMLQRIWPTPTHLKRRPPVDLRLLPLLQGVWE